MPSWMERMLVAAMMAVAVIVLLGMFYFFGVLMIDGVTSPRFIKSAILLVLAIVTLYIGAGKNIGWFTTVSSGTIKIIAANGKFIKALPNVRGWWYNPDSHRMELDSNNEHQPHWLTRSTGLYFVSWLWPIQKVHTFYIIKERLQKDPSEIQTFADKIERDDDPQEVDHLLFRIPRPFVLLDVDLSDASRLNVLLTGVFLALDVERLVFEYEAKFFDLLNTAVSGYTIDKLRHLSYDQIRQEPKTLDVGILNDINHAFCLPTIVGLQADSLIMREFSLSDADLEFQKAEQAEKLAEVRGRATLVTAKITKQQTITVAEGDAQAIELKAGAEGNRYTFLLKAQLEKGVSREDAIRTVQMQIKSEQMAKLTGTYAEGGSETRANLILQPGGRQ